MGYCSGRASHKGFLRIRIDIGPRLPEFANQRERLLFLPLIFLTVFLVIEADRFPFPVEFVFNQLDPLVVEALLLATYGRLILFCELVGGSRFATGRARRAGRVFQQLGLLRHGSQFRPLLCEELQKCPEVAIEFLLYLIDNLFSSFVLPDLFENPFLPVRNTFFCI